MDLFRLNENDFEELFYDMNHLREVFEKKLPSFQTDFGFSNSKLGTYQLNTQRKGQFYLTNAKSHFYKNILAKGEGVPNIAIYFKKKGSFYDFSFKKQHSLKENTHNVLFMEEDYKGKGVYTKNTGQESTSLHFSKSYFKQLAERYPELFEASFLRYDKGETFYLENEYMTTTFEMRKALWQLENSHLVGNTGELYADAKSLEILSMLFAPKKEQNFLFYKHCKTQSDYNKVQEVAYILLSDIHNPPTIRNLSLQVGVNEKKLKYSFKEVFGVTIYGYLFEHKMTLAKQLLQDTDKSIFEIAQKCGYEYTSHFCTAFKRRFGVSPSDSRKHL